MTTMKDRIYDPVKDTYVEKDITPRRSIDESAARSPQPADAPTPDATAATRTTSLMAPGEPQDSVSSELGAAKPINVSKTSKMRKRERVSGGGGGGGEMPLVRLSRPSDTSTPTDVPTRTSPDTRPRLRSRSRSGSPGRRPQTHDRDRDRRRSRSRSRSPSRQKRPVRRGVSPGSVAASRVDARRLADERDRRAREAAELRNRSFRGDEVVRSHYNARPSQNRTERHHSPIVNLRNFNNWVKATLIRQFARNGADVLDLGCGKGGDLQKWDKARIRNYVGLDLADVSIEQARGRYARMRHASFRAQFFVFDCFGRNVQAELFRGGGSAAGRKFDVVSMQFCLHYAYETEAKARQMLANVSDALDRGGKFLGTIPSSDAIIAHLTRIRKAAQAVSANLDTPPSWGNDIYKVEFDKAAPWDEYEKAVVFRPPYGHRYTFYLKDAVDIVPEYVVPFEAFRALAEEYHLELVYAKPFAEVFAENKDDFDAGILLDRLGVVRKDGERGIDGDEKECSDFYMAFCFEKRGR